MAPVGPVAPAMIACRVPKVALPPPRSPPRRPAPRRPPPLLPAARTGIAPCDQAYSMPAVIGAEMPPLDPRLSGSELPSPRLRLTTRAPWSTTHMMPACTSASAPAPLASSALATMSLAPGATSATWPEPSRRAHRRLTARDINGACFATHTTPCLDLLRVDELYERFPKATN